MFGNHYVPCAGHFQLDRDKFVAYRTVEAVGATRSGLRPAEPHAIPFLRRGCRQSLVHERMPKDGLTCAASRHSRNAQLQPNRAV